MEQPGYRRAAHVERMDTALRRGPLQGCPLAAECVNQQSALLFTQCRPCRAGTRGFFSVKLLVLTPCEKVLSDPFSGQSLIGVFHGLRVALPVATDPPMPQDAVVPKDWAIFSKWQLEPHEENLDYSSQIEVFWPNGTPFVNARLQAMQPTKSGMAFINRLNGFPIGQNGALRITQSLLRGEEVVFGPVELQVDVLVEVVDTFDEPTAQNLTA